MVEQRQAARGFTLIELVITMLIIAILAAVAYPTYQDSLRKGRRGAAQSFLLELANRQQQYLLDARAYAVGTGALTALNLPVPTEIAPYYTITVQPAAPVTPPVYTIIATPIAGSAQEADPVLSLDEQGTKMLGASIGW